MPGFLKLILPLASFGMCFNASAFCTASDVSVVFDNIVIQRDAPVGTVLATVSTHLPITCDAEGQASFEGSWFIQLAGSNTDHGSTPLADVRATGIEGIGIRWLNYSSTTGTTGVVTRGRGLNDDVWNRGISQIGLTNFKDTFELVKTHQTPAAGVIPAFTLGMEYSTPVSNNVKRLPLYKYTFTPINLSTVSCEINDQNVNVNMGIALLPKFNGVGSTINPVDFSIGLNCDEHTSVNIKLDNVSPLIDAKNGVLGLNSDSTAKGVGVQLLYNNAPVQFGKVIKYGVTLSRGQVVNIPFRAAYYKASTKVQSGSANATASFTMTYQ